MSFLCAFATLFSLTGLGHAVPDRNLTAFQTEYAPSFVPDPDGRGTWSLLYSCIFTLVLCVWTAIHPNLPDLYTSETHKYRLKVVWVFVAILAPEIGVLTAFKQYRRATTFVAELSRLRDEHELRRTAESNADSLDLEGQKDIRPDHGESVGIRIFRGRQQVRANENFRLMLIRLILYHPFRKPMGSTF